MELAVAVSAEEVDFLAGDRQRRGARGGARRGRSDLMRCTGSGRRRRKTLGGGQRPNDDGHNQCAGEEGIGGEDGTAHAIARGERTVAGFLLDCHRRPGRLARRASRLRVRIARRPQRTTRPSAWSCAPSANERPAPRDLGPGRRWQSSRKPATVHSPRAIVCAVPSSPPMPSSPAPGSGVVVGTLTFLPASSFVDGHSRCIASDRCGHAGTLAGAHAADGPRQGSRLTSALATARFHLYTTKVSQVCNEGRPGCTARPPSQQGKTIGPLSSPETVLGSGTRRSWSSATVTTGTSVFAVALPEQTITSHRRRRNPPHRRLLRQNATASASPSVSRQRDAGRFSPRANPSPTPSVERPPPSVPAPHSLTAAQSRSPAT